MWVERRRGRSDGSLLVGFWGWLFGLGGGESEKMSERGLVVSVGDGGVEGGVEDILICMFGGVVGLGVPTVYCVWVEGTLAWCTRPSDRRQGLWRVVAPWFGWASPCQVASRGKVSLGLRQGGSQQVSQNA